MSELFLTVVNMSISASWIVLAVLALRLLFKKAPKWITVSLWGIVAVRLVCPFAIESAISLIPSAETISPDIMMDRTPEINTGIPAINSTINPVISNSFSTEPAASANPLQILIPVLAAVWLMGIAAMLIYTGISYWRIKQKISAAVLYRDNIFQSENVISPFVLGIVNPKIYLPFKMNDKDTEHVIAHEKAHISRKDHLWKPLGFLLLALHWFNPVMWLGYVLLCRDIELACDEKVVKDMNTEQRADYSQALLTCSVNRRMIAACPLAFGEGRVKNRVKSVLNYKKPAFWIIVVAIVASVAAAVCFLTNPAPNRLKNIENLTLNSITEDTIAVWVSDDDEETYTSIGVLSSDLLQDLSDIKISRKEISMNRSEDRDARHTLVLQTKQDTENASQSYLTGLYIHFNTDFTSVWVDTGVKTTLNYKVINPQKAKEVYEYISNYNVSESIIDGIGNTTVKVITSYEVEQLRAKFPMYFDLSASKGLEVYIWQLAQGSYSCGLLPGKNLNYTQEELWNLHTASASLDEMRAIVASYFPDISQSEVVICPIQMPHSSYAYNIDDEYREEITNLFWSEFPEIQTSSYSYIIDAADFDIDGDGNSVDEAHNVQESVYEGSVEGITDKASELMFRNDISIKEIHGLKGASRAEIYQRLGEPHGSVSGGSFQQFHYILENGDIVIFSSLELDDTPQRISIYNKNGELKNIISNEV